MYTDQAAVMFPIKLEKEAPPITMGAEGYPMNIWQWKEMEQVPKCDILEDGTKTTFLESTNMRIQVVEDIRPVPTCGILQGGAKWELLEAPNLQIQPV